MSEVMQEAEATQVTEEVQQEVQQDTPVAEQPEQTSQEAVAQQDDAQAFEAGFNQAQGIETPEPEPAPEPEQKLFAGMTEEELKAAIAKAAEVDKLREQQAKIFGSLGSLKQSIDSLRNAPKPTQAQVQVTKEKFARLSKEFPEMADMLAQDLSEVLTSAPSADPVNVQELMNQSFAPTLKQMKEQFEARIDLTAMHPDWKKVVASEDFAQWTQTLPEDVRNELGNSWEAEFIGTKLSEFKEFKSKTAVSQQTKQRRLEAAITPKGQSQPTAAQTELDAFMRGFKEARGIK